MQSARDVARLAAQRLLSHYSASSSALSGTVRGLPCLQAAAGLDTLSAWPFSTSVRDALTSSRPRSLEHDRPLEAARPEAERSWLRRAALQLGGFYSRESRLRRGAKVLYDDVVEQCEDRRLYAALGLEHRFANVHAMFCLHLWLLLVRLRAEGQDGAEIAQMVYDRFQEGNEHRIRAEGVKVRITKHLADLERIFYGSASAYDKALKGEASMADALLRNVYSGEAPRQKDAELLARYVHRELASLTMTSSEAVLSGRLKFSTDFLPDLPASGGEGGAAAAAAQRREGVDPPQELNDNMKAAMAS